MSEAGERSEVRIQSGLVLSGYELQEEVGRGGFSLVHRAEPTAGGEAVAIKVAVRPELVEVLRNEGELLRRLHSPHFVRIIEEAVDADPPYFVLEYCSGGDLRALAAKHDGKRVPPERVEQMLASVLEGMAFAHEEGIVHGDLKPENVLLDGGGRPKIADLGLSRAQRKRLLDRKAAVVPSLDVTDEDAASPLRGTFDYIAPEVREGGDVSPASDVYALGVMAYELLVGHRPLGMVEPASLALRRLDPPVVLPVHLDRVVQRALSRQVGRRYPDAGIMLADLRAGADGIEMPAPPSEEPAERALRGVRPVADAPFLLGLAFLSVLPFAICLITAALGRLTRELEDGSRSLALVGLALVPAVLCGLTTLAVLPLRRGRKR